MIGKKYKRFDFLNDKSTIKKCAFCGKKFDTVGMPDYIYRREHKWYCSWTCYRNGDPGKQYQLRLGGQNK